MHRTSICFHPLAAMILLLSTGCAIGGESPRVRDFVGERAVNVLHGADRVEVFRVAAPWKKGKEGPMLGKYPLISTGKEQGKEFGTKLAQIVLDDSTYEWNIAKACEFDPGVAYRVWSGKESILVLICFHCDEIGIIADESDVKIRIHDFDRGRPALVRLARQVFPEDKEIQGLKE